MVRHLIPAPDLSLEFDLAHQFGVTHIAGVDEAGRGALAGPVFAAAVILPIDRSELTNKLAGVTDSKLLSARTRERLFPLICEWAHAFGVGSASSEVVDSDGILPATRQAMSDAVRRLAPPASGLLIDGRIRLEQINLPQRGIIRGDRLSLSIAAASILAKVSRDRYMSQLTEAYPEYGFDRHKGYGTAEHLKVLGRLGHCPEHRLSFSPLRQQLF